MAEPNMIYKIAALEMLDKAGEPLSNMQITGFFLDGRYTDYFNVQQVLSDLENTDMITSQTMHNNTRYRLTEEGQRTLALFGDKLTEAIQQDIRAYLSEHRIQFKKENALSANYDKALGGGYLVHCTAKEDQRRSSTSRFTPPHGNRRDHLQQLESTLRGCLHEHHGYPDSVTPSL